LQIAQKRLKIVERLIEMNNKEEKIVKRKNRSAWA
jgi:hypothetical protein